MGLFSFARRERRASIEDPTVPISSSNIVAWLGLSEASAAGQNVTLDSALGLPPIWSAVNFLSGTLASLPIHVYRRDGDERKRVRTGIAAILAEAANDEMSSFAWRKYLFDRTFTGGRGLSFIERATSGRVINLWPLDPSQTRIERKDGRKRYIYRDGRRDVVYTVDEVIDMPFMLGQDGLATKSPILTNKNTIGLAQAATEYGSRFFANGGVPPFALEGPFETPAGMQRAAEDLEAAVKSATKENRQALVVPDGHKLHELGTTPDKAQMVELQKFLIEQIARIYSLPPVFLQDLTHGTFSNTEQQDLHFVKHTLRRWVNQFEQELNLKLIGRNSRSMFVELNLDGLLRGDFKARMEGYAHGIQNGVVKPNEARRRENLPDDTAGDQLMIQGATVPIATQDANSPKEGQDGT